MAAGIKVDTRERIFVAGAFTGQAYVYDARTGTTLAECQLGTPGATMVNDVMLTNDAAWLTDSFRAVLYRIPLARNGTLGDQPDVRAVPSRATSSSPAASTPTASKPRRTARR